MFLGMKKRLGLFDQQPQQEPMVGPVMRQQSVPGLFGQGMAKAMQPSPIQQMTAGMPPAEKKPGINLLGVLADTLAGAAGQQGPYAAAMERRRQEEMAARQAEQQRMQARDDFAWQYDYRQQHELKDPPKPGSFEWYQTATPEQRAQYDSYNPIIIDGPDGRYAVPRSAYAGAVTSFGGGGGDDEWGPVVNERPGGASGNAGGGFPVKANAATGYASYKSGSYDPLEVAAGKEFDVPPSVLNRLRTRGERSNANQVSEVGARSVYQITPETRKLIMQKYKFDPWANPKDAARGAAIVARDMYRKFGNWNDAMTGYHGGNDTKNWGPRTRAYTQRTKM